MPVTPYVVGQWVREERFYGRRDLLAEILDGNRNCLWILGTRRIGKTSILKQLEHLAVSAPVPRYVPLFWDFQGSEVEEDLHQSFRDALLDAGERLDRLGVQMAAAENDDLFGALTHLRRELRARDLTLLLLADEVEELIHIQEQSPRLLRRLRRALQSPEGIRTVLASTLRLWRLAAEETTTSPFLHGFTPPLPIRGLTDEDARLLVRQTQLPRGAQPRLDEPAVETIRERCHNHPYLLQLLSERYLESGDLEQAIAGVANDPMVSFFFGADLGMLSDTDRRILSAIDEREAATSRSIRARLALEPAALDSGLQRLEQLGFVERSSGGDYSLSNYFFRRWFRDLPSPSAGGGSERTPSDGERPTLRAPKVESVGAGAATRRIDGRYDLLVRLGRGATGEVYKAYDTLLESVVAVKLLHGEYGGEDDAMERLRREVTLARDLSHPNILKMYHLGVDHGQPYITMQWVDGPDLARRLATGASLTLGESVAIATKLASALEALHRCHVLHRDIKPSNVLVDASGEPRLTDFGLARLKWAPGITQSGIFVGTPAYASPEQAMGEGLDERSDLYSLALLVFELVTGRMAFLGESLQELLTRRLRDAPPVPRELVPAIPVELSDLILRCLARDRAQRFQSAGELRAALEAVPDL